MLVLSRKEQQTVVIDDNVVIRVNKIGGNRVAIGIDAPEDIRVVRGELSIQPESEPRLAASQSGSARP